MSRDRYASGFDELSPAQIDGIAAEHARGDCMREIAARWEVSIWVADLVREDGDLPLRQNKRDGLAAEAARHLAAHCGHE
jgi:hypothetical protein